jgi:hypothetical protein
MVRPPDAESDGEMVDKLSRVSGDKLARTTGSVSDHTSSGLLTAQAHYGIMHARLQVFQARNRRVAV